MNRFELAASGYMMFGNSWKKELSETLNMSTTSNMLAKIVKGEKTLSSNTEQKLKDAIENKAKQLNALSNFLNNPKKISLKKSKNFTLTFDETGINQWGVFDEFPISEIGVIIYNAEIDLDSIDYEFQSLIIAAAGAEAFKTGNNFELINVVKEYFDINDIECDLDTFLISYN